MNKTLFKETLTKLILESGDPPFALLGLTVLLTRRELLLFEIVFGELLPILPKLQAILETEMSNHSLLKYLKA